MRHPAWGLVIIGVLIAGIGSCGCSCLRSLGWSNCRSPSALIGLNSGVRTVMAVPRLAGHGRFGYNMSSRAHRGRLVFTPEVRRLVMRQISAHLLWLGNAGDERDCQRILDTGIRAVVQLAAEEPVLVLPRDLVYCHFPLVDGPGNDWKLLQLAITTVANLLEKNVPTLVVCGAGQSRSPVVAAAAIALVFQQPADECLKQVAEHFPADVAPALWDEVKKVVEEGVL